MKTKIKLNSEELKNSEFSRFEIDIHLNDECHNGHDDFAITAMGRYKDHDNKYDPWDIGGCCHNEILKLRPDLKIFVDLHLCNSKGQPMYTVENGYYHLAQSPKATTIDYLRITSNEYDILKNSGDKLHFCLQLENMGLIERWQNEANEAIKLLESMTGEIYKDSTTKETFTPLTEGQRLDLHNKLGEGYYTIEEINKRKSQSIEDKKQKTINELIEKATNDKKKIDIELSVKLAVLNYGLSLDNFIYYNHTNEGVFNWLDYYKKITIEELNVFIQSVDFSKLPEGIKFKLEK